MRHRAGGKHSKHAHLRWGQVILTASIHGYFFRYDDRSVGHDHRYEVTELLRELSVRGFENFRIENIAGLADNLGMFAATLAFRLISTNRLQDHGPVGSVSILRRILPLYKSLTRLYGWVARAEARIIPQSLAIILVRSERSTQ